MAIGRISRNLYIDAKNGHCNRANTPYRYSFPDGHQQVQRMRLLTVTLDRLSDVSSRRLAWATGAAFAVVTVVMASIRYAGLQTTFYDLGAFER
jgi:hypothetical protein